MFTEEDLNMTRAIGAIITNQINEILILDHIKLNCWSIPVGKVKNNQSFEEALVEEVIEECGIKILDYSCIDERKYFYTIQDKNIEVDGKIYLITKWIGFPSNKEKQKHRSMEWMTMEMIKEIPRLSDMTKTMIKGR